MLMLMLVFGLQQWYSMWCCTQSVSKLHNIPLHCCSSIPNGHIFRLYILDNVWVLFRPRNPDTESISLSCHTQQIIIIRSHHNNRLHYHLTHTNKWSYKLIVSSYWPNGKNVMRKSSNQNTFPVVPVLISFSLSHLLSNSYNDIIHNTLRLRQKAKCWWLNKFSTWNNCIYIYIMFSSMKTKINHSICVHRANAWVVRFIDYWPSHTPHFYQNTIFDAKAIYADA